MSTTLQEQIKSGFPAKQGLYDPAFEKDSCGVGFVAHIKGKASHQIVVDAEIMLQRMEHRGGCGCEPNTGDGSGILTGMPHEFCIKAAKQDLGIDLPKAGLYSAGNVFLPTDKAQRQQCMATVERVINEQGQQFLGWREVPVDTEGADIGPTARRAQPHILQLYIAIGNEAHQQNDEKYFERELYVIRKRCSHLLRGDKTLSQAKMFYICSLSPRIIIYKGMLNALQVKNFYLDLQDADYTSHIAMVHSRFSTNTFPSWDRAQPNRYMSHNGEINTLLGNKNWMSARQGVVRCDDYSCEIEQLFPIAEQDCSDSGNFDNVLEFLLMSGRSLPEAVMLMVPEAWQSDKNMAQAKKDFYRFNSAMMEPWDGPASIAFTDGHYIGAVLDRNGLRPSRYYLTKDDRVIMASEVGVVDIEPSEVKFKGRLQPGKMFLIDFEKGELISDEALKKDFSTRRPYGEWLKNQEIKLSDLTSASEVKGLDSNSVIARMKAFGYTTETMQFMLLPLVRELRDPVGSMGNDSALACLSDKPRMIYDYFKQLFAQVTNPAIDSIREEVVMSLECYIGPEGNLLKTTEQHAHRLRITHPILTNTELSALKNMDYRGWKSKTIDITYDKAEGVTGLEKCLDKICAQASEAIRQGDSIIVLSDRATSSQRIPVSTLLATGAVHHHLVKNQERTRIGLVLETGEAREVHQHCLLIGYGADAINPYLAFESLLQAQQDGLLDAQQYNEQKIIAAYRKGIAKGMLKVMAKIGISTLHSYKGAQIFEAVGLAEDVISRCFKGTASRIKGVGLEVLAEESLRRHQKAYPQRQQAQALSLDNPGDFHWRSGGEVHMWNPETLANIQLAARTNSKQAYQQFAKVSDDDSTRRATLRGLLQFKKDANGGAISIDEVEPAKEIVKRFVTGAMSFGSISAESHETLAIAMNRLGGKSNTGEGGEDEKRFTPMANGDSKRSSIKQIASGRFGVTNWYLTNADELQIKVSQGAKPGEGGELPGAKVDINIARLRHSTPGVGLISPPPHHDIYSIEDLSQLIHDLKNANPSARISVKLVAEIGVGTIASGVTKSFADHIVIAGHDGGTGASPLTSVKHAGLPWELGVAETHQTLVMNDLRSRVVLQTDGQLKTGRDITIAALLGAEEFGFSTAPLITLGCIMMRKCHLNTCPVGIATQDKELRKKFKGKPEHLVNYLFMVAEDMRAHMATLGFKTVNEMIGRVDVLETKDVNEHWKAKDIDLSALLKPAQKPHDTVEVYQTQTQNHGLEKALDNEIIKQAKATIAHGEKTSIELPIVNTNRVVGTMLSHELAKAHQGKPLADNTLQIKLTGSAGQSLAAWLYQGVTIELEGDANDYVGKGLSGGRLIVYPPKNSSFVAEDNIIVGNTVLYGATSGEAYFRGIAAERFCVRNSGAHTVIEGVGDHGCEYMTGGRVVVLGKTGRNFAAGMSGGVAYIWDKEQAFASLCNMEMVALESVVEDEDISELKILIENHLKYTNSANAKLALENWQQTITQFVKVMPTDYKRVLQEMKKQQTKVVA